MSRAKLIGAASVIAMTSVAIGAAAMQAQKVTGPKARYVMDASTTSGMMAGGGNPMAMMRGGSESRELLLRLGSTLAPTAGAPKADHFMPTGMKLGASVPLETPRSTPGTPGQDVPRDFQRPKGRLLIFWGCGAKAGPGQPVVIDFAKLAAGQVPPNLFSTTVPVETGPLQGNSKTFGTWPNAMQQQRKTLDARSSLLGQHRVAGNYSPEISFALQQDFMPAIRGQSADGAGGSINLSWNSVTGATGYYAWGMGGKDMGQGNADMVWWTSSSTQQFGAGLWDWLSPATVAKLIGQKVVMPPSQTQCTVPAEVKTATGGMFMNFLYAYGPEADFSYPPRPSDPKQPWNIEWTAKVRFRATTMMMAGMPGMPDMSSMDDEDGGDGSPAPAPRKECKPSVGGMIGGMLGGRKPKGC